MGDYIQYTTVLRALVLGLCCNSIYGAGEKKNPGHSTKMTKCPFMFLSISHALSPPPPCVLCVQKTKIPFSDLSFLHICWLYLFMHKKNNTRALKCILWKWRWPVLSAFPFLMNRKCFQHCGHLTWMYPCYFLAQPSELCIPGAYEPQKSFIWETCRVYLLFLLSCGHSKFISYVRI